MQAGEIILGTKNYSLFKKSIGNRPIQSRHLNKLKQAIQRDNQLKLHPIIVNKDYYVIDGQHRIEAAKQLNCEVFYVKSMDVKEGHIIECNVNQRCWEIENYIDYYATKEKNPDYIMLKDALKSSALKPKALLSLLFGNMNAKMMDGLKKGEYQSLKDTEMSEIMTLYNDFMSYCKDKRIKPFSMFTNYKFTQAFRWLHKTTGFDAPTFFKKLDLKWFDMKPKSSAQDWYEILIDIYNFRSHTKIEKEFGEAVK
jgi:hypothetical protein